RDDAVSRRVLRDGEGQDVGSRLFDEDEWQARRGVHAMKRVHGALVCAAFVCGAIELTGGASAIGPLPRDGQSPPIDQNASFQKVPPPIELQVEPPSVPAGGRVQIRGSAAVGPKDPAVQITVILPAPAREKRPLSA